MVRVDVQHVRGVALEEIPLGPRSHRIGMVLTRFTWRHLYFLKERAGWHEDDYFDLAERLIAERGINAP